MSHLSEFYEAVGAIEAMAPADTQPKPPESFPSTILRAQSGAPTGAVRAWAASGDRFWGISEQLDTLPGGCFTAQSTPEGIILIKLAIQTDSLLHLPDSASDNILQEIAHFNTLRPEFDKRGFLYKRGILLWGQPGSGKTSTIQLLLKLIIDGGGIGFMVYHPWIGVEGLRLIRRIEPHRQIICIMEDLDGLVAAHGTEKFLAILDGEDQIDNVIFIATTNYPERLDKRLVDRPSRFDTVEYIGMPSADARRLYLSTKDPGLDSDVLDQMVAQTEGLSIAHLRELIIATQCFKKPISDVIERLTTAHRRLPSSDKAPGRLGAGFSGGTAPRHVHPPALGGGQFGTAASGA